MTRKYTEAAEKLARENAARAAKAKLAEAEARESARRHAEAQSSMQDIGELFVIYFFTSFAMSVRGHDSCEQTSRG